MTTENTAREQTLAERMYPDIKPATAPAPVSSPPAADLEGLPPVVPAIAGQEATDSNEGPPQMTADEVLAEEQSLAECMYDGAARIPEAPGGYAPALDYVFDTIQREEAETIGDEERALLSEGRKAVAELMLDLSVPVDVAREVAKGIGEWRTRDPLPPEKSEALQMATRKELRAEWGNKYDAKIGFAQAAAVEAMKRLPWLEDLLGDGAGNDSKLIRHFAKIGERNARRAGAKR